MRMFKAHQQALDQIMEIYGSKAYSHFSGTLRKRRSGSGYVFTGWDSMRFSTKERANAFMNELFQRCASKADLLTRDLLRRCADRMALLDAVITNYSTGPYEVYKTSSPTVVDGWHYAVRDGRKRKVVLGHQHECEQIVDQWKTEYAKYLMLRS